MRSEQFELGNGPGN